MLNTMLLIHCLLIFSNCFFFFFNDTATTEIYTLSLHDALPISYVSRSRLVARGEALPRRTDRVTIRSQGPAGRSSTRSEEHTSELQSRSDLVCRLLLEKKKKNAELSVHTYRQKTQHEISQHVYD